MYKLTVACAEHRERFETLSYLELAEGNPMYRSLFYLTEAELTEHYPELVEQCLKVFEDSDESN